MKALSALFAGLVFALPAAAQEHVVHVDHAHVHGPDCGHAAEQHGDHVDYNHDGHDHHTHVQRSDEAGNEVHECDIVIHENHEHVHGPNCGHKTRVKNGITEYLHDGHWHHMHGNHVHESHD